MTKFGGLVPLVFFGVILAVLAAVAWGLIAPLVGDLGAQVVGEMSLSGDATFTDEQLVTLFPAPLEATANNQVSRHGLDKHPEAGAIGEACNKGIYQVWRDRREKKYYYLCKIGEDLWGIVPVVITGGTEIWKTAFSPGSGCWADTIRYLTGYATRYTGSVH